MDESHRRFLQFSFIFLLISALRSSLCGDLKNVNYLLRQQSRGKGVPFAFFLFPSDGEEFIYISDVASYAFLDSGNISKNQMLKQAASYLHSYETLRYTENLGMLPCVPCDKITYEKYPHLKPYYGRSSVYYTVRDENARQLLDTAQNAVK